MLPPPCCANELRLLPEGTPGRPAEDGERAVDPVMACCCCCCCCWKAWTRAVASCKEKHTSRCCQSRMHRIPRRRWWSTFQRHAACHATSHLSMACQNAEAQHSSSAKHKNCKVSARAAAITSSQAGIRGNKGNKEALADTYGGACNNTHLENNGLQLLHVLLQGRVAADTCGHMHRQQKENMTTESTFTGCSKWMQGGSACLWF